MVLIHKKWLKTTLCALPYSFRPHFEDKILFKRTTPGIQKMRDLRRRSPAFQTKVPVNNHVRITHATSPGWVGSVAAWEAQRRIYLASPTADLASGLVQPWVSVFVTRFHYSGCDTYNRGCYDPQGIPQLSPTRKERNVRVPTPAGATYWCTKHQHACLSVSQRWVQSVEPHHLLRLQASSWA